MHPNQFVKGGGNGTTKQGVAGSMGKDTGSGCTVIENDKGLRTSESGSGVVPPDDTKVCTGYPEGDEWLRNQLAAMGAAGTKQG